MTLRGHIEGGRVVLDEPVDLPDGTAVEVAVAARNNDSAQREIPTLYERMKDFIGIIKDMPEDFAQHDRYLRGTRRGTERQ